MRIATFCGDGHLRQAPLSSLRLVLAFHGPGLGPAPTRPSLWSSPRVIDPHLTVLTPARHHYSLRLSRILRCLTILGLQPYARALLDCLEGVFSRHATTIGEETLAYWRNAVGRTS